MVIIGITGTLGAGKGTLVDYLVNHKEFLHFSVRGYLLEVIEKRGLEPNRDNMVVVANEIRTQNTPSYIVDQLYERAKEQTANCVIESIRTPGEIDSLRKNERFYLFAVDANPKIRYERIKNRNSETDHISFEEFRANEEREMNSDNPNNQNLRKCIERADFVFDNNGTIDDLFDQFEKVLTKIDN